MKKIVFSFVVIAIAIIACKKDESTTTDVKVVTAPTVITEVISDITQISALSGVSVISDGGTTVTSSGVCWDTSTNPTVSLSTKTTGGTGNITTLSANTTYFVRAYATNSAGTSYGNEITFTTTSFGVKTVPTLTTTTVSAITKITATSGVSVISDGGATVTVSGVCWGTSTNPTTSLSTKTTDGTGNITALTANTTYFVRAYATNSVGVAYGNEVSFKTQAEPVSFSKDVAPIITTNCAFSGSCHGGIIALSRGNFTTYSPLKSKVDNGLFKFKVFDTKLMPQGGSLTSAQLATLQAWVDAGAKDD